MSNRQLHAPAIDGRLCLFSVIISVCALNSHAVAGGFDYPDLGAVGLSRGGAFVARADDPTAIYYNPAGAARLRGTHVMLNGHLLFESVSFQRRIYRDGVSPGAYLHDASLEMPRVTNQDSPFFAPFVAITSDLGGLTRPINLVVLAGLYSSNGHPAHTFPRFCAPGSTTCREGTAADNRPNPARYDMVSRDVLLFFPTLGLAWQPIDGLSIGAVFQLGYVKLDYVNVVGAVSDEDPATDIESRFGVDSGPTPTGIIGVHWRALRWLELGASVRIGFTFNTSGELESIIPQSVTDQLGVEVKTEPNPARGTLRIPQPTVLRVGARYVHHDAKGRELFDIEADFVWENTSVLDQFLVETKLSVRSAINFDITKIKLPRRWRDTFSARVGGALRLHDLIPRGQLVLRGGVFYESAAIDPTFISLDFVPLSRLGVALGIGVRWGRFDFNVGYAHLFHFAQDVAPAAGQPECDRPVTGTCGSGVKQIVPLRPTQDEPGTIGEGKPIGNGNYDASIHQVTFGASVRFGS